MPSIYLGEPEDWHFKGEGNANAVFGYSGAVPHLEGCCLRVRKQLKDVNMDPTVLLLEQEIWKDVPGMEARDELRREAAFVEGVMRHCLSPSLVYHQEVVQLPGRLSSALREMLRRKGRPSAVDPQLEWGVLLPDHTCFLPSAPSTSAPVPWVTPVAKEGNPGSPRAVPGRLHNSGTGAGAQVHDRTCTQQVSEGLGHPGPEGPVHCGACVVPQGYNDPGAGQGQADGNVLLPTLCVEIKPKWGAAMPVPRHSRGGNAVPLPALGAAPLPDAQAPPLPDLDATQLPSLDAAPLPHLAGPISRFHLKQLLKLAQGHVSRISRYNPLDLFSGRAERLARALSALLEDPQNNLKLFVNGHPVPQSAVGTAFDSVAVAYGGSRESLQGLLLAALQSEGVLARLLAVQCLDSYGTEAVHEFLEELHISRGPSEACPTATSEKQACCGTPGDVNTPSRVEETKPSRSAMLAAVRDYLISVCARDCSLMLTIAPLADHGPLHGLPEHAQGRSCDPMRANHERGGPVVQCGEASAHGRLSCGVGEGADVVAATNAQTGNVGCVPDNIPWVPRESSLVDGRDPGASFDEKGDSVSRAAGGAAFVRQRGKAESGEMYWSGVGGRAGPLLGRGPPAWGPGGLPSEEVGGRADDPTPGGMRGDQGQRGGVAPPQGDEGSRAAPRARGPLQRGGALAYARVDVLTPVGGRGPAKGVLRVGRMDDVREEDATVASGKGHHVGSVGEAAADAVREAAAEVVQAGDEERAGCGGRVWGVRRRAEVVPRAPEGQILLWGAGSGGDEALRGGAGTGGDEGLLGGDGTGDGEGLFGGLSTQEVLGWVPVANGGRLHEGVKAGGLLRSEHGRLFQWKVALVDLDQKRLGVVGKNLRQERKMWSLAGLNNLQEGT
eukprot:jgi/Botrbrau1/16888/Bobra.150_2s0102.2